MKRVAISLHFIPYFSLFLFVLISKSAANCWDKEKSVDMTQDFDVEVGSPFTLNCTLHRESIIIDENKYYANASYIIFKKGDRLIEHAEKIVVSPLTALLKVNVSEANDTGYYNCIIKLPDTKKDITICSSRVCVGYKPTPPVNFSCKILHYKTLQCGWSTEPNNVTITSKIYQKQNSKHNVFSVQQCPHKERSSSNYWMCEWKLTSNPAFNQFILDYDFVVESSNSLGSRDDTFKMHRDEIVLPGQPKHLTYRNLQPKSLTLEWQYPDEMENFLSRLIYQLVYYKVNKNFTKDLKVINVTSNEKHIFYNITNLIPHMQYKFEVRCRSNASKGDYMWSKNETIVIQTKEDVPYIVPEIIKEAFEVQKSENNYRITLYWKPVPEEFRNGKNFFYVVTYTPLNISYEESNIVLYNNKINSSSSHVTFNNLNSSIAYEFKVYSANDNGISEKSNTIVVDKWDNLLPSPVDVAVISYGQDYFNISWKPVYKTENLIKGYTVFWCTNLPRSYNLLSKPCNGSIHWKHVSAKTTSIKHPMSDLQTNIKFAVAAVSTSSSSGMVWAPCMISYNDTVVKIREPFSITAKNFSTLHIAWSFDCNAQKALIKEFYIIYCRTKDERSNCIDKIYSHKLENKSEEHYYIIGLASKTYYRIFIRIITTNGKKVDSAHQFVQTPSEGTSPEMIVSIIVGVSFTCICLTFIICFLVKWMKKKYDAVKGIKIKLPEGLNGPLGSYENFKKGLLQQNTSLPPLKPRPGSFVLDNNKNRCISVLSNSSAEELLYKNIDRCNNYWRNPSGDSSSGCSSNGIHDSISSSNTNHTHLSTDSGAELDILPVNTIDNVFCDPSLILKSKIHSKSEIDIQNDKSSDSGLDKEIPVVCGTKTEMEQPTSTANFILPLNNQSFQHPYSKFGLNGPNSLYSKQWNNILTINSNLCNSEPSIININNNSNDKNKPLASIPYSKIGISRSSESIDHFPKDNQDYYKNENFIENADKNKDFELPAYVCSNLQHKNNVLKPYISMGSYFESIVKVPNCKEGLPVNSKGNDDNMAYSKFDIHPSVDVVSSQVNPYIPVQQAHSMMQGVILPEINLNPSFDINIFNFNNNLPPSEVSSPDTNVGEELLNTDENFYSSKEHAINGTACTYGCDKEIDLSSEDCIKRQKSDATENESPQTSNVCYAEEPYKKFKYVNGNGTTPEGNNFEVIMAPQQLEQSDCAPSYISPFRFEEQSNEVNSTSNENGYVHLPAVYYV
ncbi:interleukin-12 receptor subunit beta-2-like [Centruroides vittatus]|uniref:interleukin-12 receptor subunit beta-2-like n=1 Tax=Centruroides vittatus TaxID=120091 RepID=UPI00350F541F